MNGPGEKAVILPGVNTHCFLLSRTQGHLSFQFRPSGLSQSSPTLGRAGEGLGLFFTSIQLSESRSGRLADRPLGRVFRLLTSSVLVGTGVTARGEPGADSEGRKSRASSS